MRTRTRLALLAATTLTLGSAALLALDAAQAADSLRLAEASAGRVQAFVDAGDPAAAVPELVALGRHTSAARDRLHGPLWDGAAAVPWLGRTATAMRDGATVADEVGRQVLPALVDTAVTLTSPQVRPAGDRIDLEALRRLAPVLQAADARLQRLVARPEPSGVLPAVAERRARMADLLADLSRGTHAASVALARLPEMLGASGLRRYFLAFQNPSESRGTGGLVGAYGILEADDGVLTLPVIDDNRTLARLPRPRVDLGADHRALYGSASRLWANTNLSPHFPYAARAWIDSWQRHSGQHLDGVLATDPVGLSHLLRALGPVQLPDGTAVTPEDVVERTGWDAYADFDGRTEARKDFLVEVARAVVTTTLDGTAPASELVRALLGAARDGRLRAYSVRRHEQQALAQTPLAGELPAATGPFAAVVVNNLAGNKLDYHLRRDVEYEQSSCTAVSRLTAVRVALTNAVPPGPLPSYTSGRLDLADGQEHEPGSTKLQVALYATHGAALRQLTVDGVRTPVAIGAERGHPVFAVAIELARGQRRVLEFRLEEPRTAGTPTVPVQPLVEAQRTRVVTQRCA